MKEQEILDQIIIHYTAFAEHQIEVIARYLDDKNMYGAKEAAQELVYGLDDAGNHLIFPARFILMHPKDCGWCNPKKE